MADNNEIKSKIVQTYAEDMAEVLEDDKTGLVKKIIHGEEEREKEKRELSPESKKNKIFMIASFLFFVITMAVLSFTAFSRKVSTVSVEEQFRPIIFNDKNIFLEVKGLKKDEIVHSVLKEILGAEIKSGKVEGIYLILDRKIVGLRKFMTLLEGALVLPEVDFVSDNFLFGVVHNVFPLLGENVYGTSKDFFMLLKTRTLSDIFDPLRAWESKIFSDLHGFFDVDISSRTNYLLTANFEDGIIENKNARVLYSNDRKIVMMYIFADDNSVIITNTESAAHEIMLRLASSKVEK